MIVFQSYAVFCFGSCFRDSIRLRIPLADIFFQTQIKQISIRVFYSNEQGFAHSHGCVQLASHKVLSYALFCSIMTNPVTTELYTITGVNLSMRHQGLKTRLIRLNILPSLLSQMRILTNPSGSAYYSTIWAIVGSECFIGRFSPEPSQASMTGI